MIKHYCDICGEEITGKSNYSVKTISRVIMKIPNIIGCETLGNLQKTLEECEEKEYCSNCYIELERMAQKFIESKKNGRD